MPKDIGRRAENLHERRLFARWSVAAMFTQPSAHEPSCAFVAPSESRGDSSSLRRRVVALMRTVDEREATIAGLVRQLHRARNDPSRSVSVGRLTASAAHEMQAPIHRAVEYARFLRRSFERIESKTPERDGAAIAELDCVTQLLDDLDRVAAIARAMENFSPPPDSGAADTA
jgi:light-regulated signal transduction histidine kinase (bacteriophytochrome)